MASEGLSVGTTRVHLAKSVAYVDPISGIECVRNKRQLEDPDEGKLLLSQIEVCLDKSLNLIDCEPHQFGGCSPTQPINSYPKKTHRDMQYETTTSELKPIDYLKFSASKIATLVETWKLTRSILGNHGILV